MAKGSWRDAAARLLGRSDVKNPGVGRGNHDSVRGGHVYNDYGITDRQQEVLDAYKEGGWRNAARVCDISKNGVYRILEDIADRWGLDHHSTEAVLDTYGDLEAGVYDASQLTQNYTDTTVEGGDNPWSGYWDADGNWVE